MELHEMLTMLSSLSVSQADFLMGWLVASIAKNGAVTEEYFVSGVEAATGFVPNGVSNV